jgi:hypothetical protein
MDGQFLEAAFALTQEGRGRMRHSMPRAIVKDFSDTKKWDEILRFSPVYSSLFKGKEDMFISQERQGPEIRLADGMTKGTVGLAESEIPSGFIREMSLVSDPTIMPVVDHMSEGMAPTADTEEDFPDYGLGYGIASDQGPYMTSLIVLQDLAIKLNISKESIGEQFRTWIFDSMSLDPIQQQYEGPAAEFWRTLSDNPHWQQLSELARIIFTAPSSEAVCERNFSRRKWVTSRTSAATLPDLMEARIQGKF